MKIIKEVSQLKISSSQNIFLFSNQQLEDYFANY